MTKVRRADISDSALLAKEFEQILLSRRLALKAGSALALASTLPSPAYSQTPSEWPSKPVRLVVPFPAGGGADLGARTVAIHLGNTFGKPVVVENRAGADGAVAALEVIKAPPDGHTLFFGTATSMSYVPSLKRNPPYDPVVDFTPISTFCIFTFYLMVSPSLKVRNLAEFIAFVKGNPGKVAYATGNSTGILAMGQLISSNKLDMTAVPYKGEAQAVIDLVGGRVPVMFATPAIMPQLLKEKFVPLAVLLPKRTATLPEVPTMVEAGQPLVNIMPWGGLLGPAKMPAELVERISRDFGAVMRRADVGEQYEKLGLFPQPSSPSVLAEQIKDQLGVWNKTMRSLGMPLE
jgi:tripartite-type tricarboxylate transporter receptor subunit TctC